MQSTAREFPLRARLAVDDSHLRQALEKAQDGFVGKRQTAIDAFPEFDALRARGTAIKDHTLAYLDVYLEQFESALLAAGGQVHWAESAEDAQRIVTDICRQAGGKRVTKAKTMAGEEISLNDTLETVGFETVETDLGEYIIQLAKEPPSHIIAPAVHKTRQQISDLFNKHHHGGRLATALREVPELVDEARQRLREKFLTADVGITGANFLVAETGSIALVTNEGNADLTHTLPKVHIAIAGIEKLVPTLDDTACMLRLLARSATGQDTSTYTTFVTGPRRAGDPDGPEALHVVLLDNGRSRMLGNRYREMLRCIRCGACMNHCPVYGAIGGHAYGWVYPGPMGAVLTPLFTGLDGSRDLPNACTLNGRCQSVCPVQIPLPDLLRDLRRQQFERGLTTRRTRWGLAAWGAIARRPRLYHLCARLGIGLLGRIGRRKGAFRWLPFASAWTASRDMPAPQGTTFQRLWKQRQRDSRS